MRTEELRRLMEERKISAYRLAKMTGVNNATICRIVNGEDADPRGSIVKKIADALGVKADDLL